MKYELDTDEQLIIAIKNDDYVCYNKLYKRYFKRLCGYVYQIIHDIYDTEDIIQDLFLNIWNNRKKIDVQENVQAYLVTMAKNLTMNHIRKDSNYRMILEQQEKLSSFIVEDNSLEYAEFQYSLYDCIENLSNRGKEILLLHRLKGLKQKEIADKLNITVKTVKNQIWISLQKLRNCLQHKGVSI